MYQVDHLGGSNFWAEWPRFSGRDCGPPHLSWGECGADSIASQRAKLFPRPTELSAVEPITIKSRTVKTGTAKFRAVKCQTVKFRGVRPEAAKPWGAKFRYPAAELVRPVGVQPSKTQLQTLRRLATRPWGVRPWGVRPQLARPQLARRRLVLRSRSNQAPQLAILRLGSPVRIPCRVRILWSVGSPHPIVGTPKLLGIQTNLLGIQDCRLIRRIELCRNGSGGLCSKIKYLALRTTGYGARTTNY